MCVYFGIRMCVYKKIINIYIMVMYALKYIIFCQQPIIFCETAINTLYTKFSHNYKYPAVEPSTLIQKIRC